MAMNAISITRTAELDEPRPGGEDRRSRRSRRARRPARARARDGRLRDLEVRPATRRRRRSSWSTSRSSTSAHSRTRSSTTSRRGRQSVPNIARRRRARPGAKPPGKYKVLAEIAEKYTLNVGYPGNTNAAIDEIFNKFLIPQMFAEVAQDKRTPEDAARIYDRSVPRHLPEVAEPREDLAGVCAQQLDLGARAAALRSAGEAPEPARRGARRGRSRAAAQPARRQRSAAGRFYGGHPPLPYVPGCECVGRDPTGGSSGRFGDGIGLARDGGHRGAGGAPADVLGDGARRRRPGAGRGARDRGAGRLAAGRVAGAVRTGETVLVLGATGTVGLVARAGGAAPRRRPGRRRGTGGTRRPLEHAPSRCGSTTTAWRTAATGERRATARRSSSTRSGASRSSAAVAARRAGRADRPSRPVGRAGGDHDLGRVRARQAARPPRLHELRASRARTLAREYRRLVQHAIAGEIRVELERVPLDGVADAWQRQADGPGRKLVRRPVRP